MHICPECGLSLPGPGYCPADGTPLAAAGDDVLLGQTIDHYRIARLLGVGGMGRVYKGVHPAIGSRVAVKVLSRECVDSPEMIDRFFDEARAVNLIRHESIVNVLLLEKLPDGRPYIVMEYLDGAPLSDLIRKQQPLPLGGLARLVGEVLGALDAAHQKGIYHRDLKPDNIFVSPAGRGKVLDFGIAKLRPELTGRSGPTRTGSLLGTPHYMAPEQAMARGVDGRTDVYAMGVILFEGATGRRPFNAESLYELLRMQVDDPPPRPVGLRPDLPLAYEAVILHAMAKDPAHRFQSVGEFAHALADASRDLPAQAWATLTPGAGAGAGFAMASHAVKVPMGPPAVPTPPTAPRSPLFGPGQLPMHPSAAGTPTSGQMQQQMMPPPPRPAPRRGKTGWILGGSIAAIAAVAIVVAVMSSSRPGDGTGDGEQEHHAAGGDNGTDNGTDDGTDDGTVAQSGNPAVDKYLQTAQQIQKKVYGDVDGALALAQKQLEALEASDDKASKAMARALPGAERVTGAAGRVVADASGGTRYLMPNTYRPRGFDATEFDVSGFLASATAIARIYYEDADLVRIDAQGVYPDGRADLTLGESYYVIYTYNSPARMRPTRELPVGVKNTPKDCKIQVWVDANGVRPHPVPHMPCDEQPIGEPSCTARSVWERAIAKGAPRENAVATMLGYWEWQGKGRWYLTVGDVFSNFVPDDQCE